jgi:hypothetical protein
MVQVITAGGTARLVLDGPSCEAEDADALASSLRRCAEDGVEELLISIPGREGGWRELVEGGIATAPDPLRIWLAVGETEPALRD